jgi:hypothetical protein
MPGTKKEPHENTRQTADRILQEMLNMTGSMVKWDLSNIDRHEEETESPSYPGVRTVYRKEILEGVVTSTDEGLLSKIGLPGFSSYNFTDPLNQTKTFEWMTPGQATGKGVKLKPEENQQISTLVRAPIGLAEDALRQHLTSFGIDVSRFGQAGTRTLKEFSAELIRGEATLVQDGGTMVRVVDVVLLIISRGSTSEEILVQTEQVHSDGAKTVLNRLPGAKRRPDENQFLSARRILRRQLEFDENQVQLNINVQNVEEEKSSSSYPGLKTVYRKRLIKAHLIE